VLLTLSLNSYCTYRRRASTRRCQWRCYMELHRSSRIPGRLRATGYSASKVQNTDMW